MKIVVALWPPCRKLCTPSLHRSVVKNLAVKSQDLTRKLNFNITDVKICAFRQMKYHWIQHQYVVLIQWKCIFLSSSTKANFERAMLCLCCCYVIVWENVYVYLQILSKEIRLWFLLILMSYHFGTWENPNVCENLMSFFIIIYVSLHSVGRNAQIVIKLLKFFQKSFLLQNFNLDLASMTYAP